MQLVSDVVLSHFATVLVKAIVLLTLLRIVINLRTQAAHVDRKMQAIFVLYRRLMEL